MNSMTFSCEKCFASFTSRVVGGTKVRCYKCDHVMYVPVYDELIYIDKEFLINEHIKFILKLSEGKLENGMSRKLKSQVIGLSEKLSEWKKTLNFKELEDWEIICKCNRCDQTYKTNKKNNGFVGLCMVCKETFMIHKIEKDINDINDELENYQKEHNYFDNKIEKSEEDKIVLH